MSNIMVGTNLFGGHYMPSLNLILLCVVFLILAINSSEFSQKLNFDKIFRNIKDS